jgi:hypothetical protein
MSSRSHDSKDGRPSRGDQRASGGSSGKGAKTGVSSRSATEKIGGVSNVTSGDRSSVPHGGSTRSHHLEHRAADFHVSGRSDKAVFDRLKTDKKAIFDNKHRYQVILHGPFTVTTGPHVHVGRYKDGTGAVFYKEGTTKQTKGKYQKLKSN